MAYNSSLARGWIPEEPKRFGIARFAKVYPAYCAGLLLIPPFIAKGLYNQVTRSNAAHWGLAAVFSWSSAGSETSQLPGTGQTGSLSKEALLIAPW